MVCAFDTAADDCTCGLTVIVDRLRYFDEYSTHYFSDFSLVKHAR